MRHFIIGGRGSGKTAAAKLLLKDIPNVTTPKPRPMGSPRLLGNTQTATNKVLDFIELDRKNPTTGFERPYRNQPLRHNMLLADLKTSLLKEGGTKNVK